MLKVIGDSVDFITQELFIAQTEQGNYVIFAPLRNGTGKTAICVILKDGTVYRRIKYCDGAHYQRVNAQLATLAGKLHKELNIEDFSENIWSSAEARANRDIDKPPPPAFRVAAPADVSRETLGG